LAAQKSENTRVAAIMVNDSGKLEGYAIKAGNIIGQVGKISEHIHGLYFSIVLVNVEEWNAEPFCKLKKDHATSTESNNNIIKGIK